MKKTIFTVYALLISMIVITGCASSHDGLFKQKVVQSPNDSNHTVILVSTKSPAKNATPASIQGKSNLTSAHRLIPDTATKKSSADSSWYKPKPGISWFWQLQGTIDTSYDVDVYDIDLVEAPQAVIDELHRRNIKVICYFSAGTWEAYRDDAPDFPSEVMGKAVEGYPDERYLNVAQYQKFANIMQQRLDLAVQKKCDGVEPDNMDGYATDNGFDISYENQVTYSLWIAEQAHTRNLSVALKNGLDQIKDVLDYFDFAINEQCFQYHECDKLLPFITQGKAVLGVEYELETDAFCAQANRLNFSWLKMDYALDGRRISCR